MDKDYIKNFISYLKSIGNVKTQKEFALIIGYQSESAFSQAIKKNPIPIDTFNKIKNIYPEFDTFLEYSDEKVQASSKDFFKRLSILIDNEGINITALEKLIGASKGVLSRGKRKSTSISIEWVIKIVEKYRQYDANWLLLGEGEMLKKVTKSDEAEVTFLRENNNILKSQIKDKNEKEEMYREKIEQLEEELTALKKRILFTEETESKIA